MVDGVFKPNNYYRLDDEIYGTISDPLYESDLSNDALNDALKIRSLDNGQIASKAFNSSLVVK